MLYAHRAARADHLVGALADVLEQPPDEPFAREVVAVHSNGIERWVAQQLAARLGTSSGGHDGVCANVRFGFPGHLVGELLRRSVEQELDPDPWVSRTLVWHLLALLESGSVDPGPLRAHVQRGVSRFAAARTVADLFDRYAVHRPEMLLAWAAGEDVDAAGAPLEADRRWQAVLWRALRQQIGIPSHPERLEAAIAALREDTLELDLPGRLSLFGLTALPARDLEVLRALAEHREVHLFLLHPSPGMWDAVASDAPVGLPARDDDPTRAGVRHPLLASWGRDVREMQLVLGHAGITEVALRGAEAANGDGDPTLLQRLQRDLGADRPPPGLPLTGDERRAVLAGGDRSVQVHSCHGRTRQVEVLRDAIGHLLAADASLEPRDVIVMCPDVEQFAPLVHAVFGAEAVREARDEHGLPDLRVRLADRSLRRTNPVLEVAARLLELVDSRFEASRVLDLAGREPVRRRFRFDDDDLGRFEDWADGVGIRWGLHAAHRAEGGLESVEANTWRAGLDRLLVGVAVADDDLRMVGPVVPFDVEGEDADRAGRLAELLARLEDAAARLSSPQPVADWCVALAEAVDHLASVSDRDLWQRQQLQRILDEVTDEARSPDGAPSAVPLELAEIRALLDDRLAGRPSWASHRTGDLTVCSLVPMRSVPHRVVCLLGMDDAAFPRRTLPDGDDLIDAAARVGDRDARTEDRQLLLDALLAASDAVVVTYTGRDERTNEPRPPAVPIGELLDVIDATVVVPADTNTQESTGPRPGQRARAREQVVVEHPLQGFDPRNFTPGRLGVPGGWRFERTDLAGALALRAPRETAARFVAEPLPLADGEVLALDDLIDFLHHPVRAFLARRLGIRLRRPPDQRQDAIPVEPSPLVRYAVGQRRLDAALAGADPQRWERVERARGALPPGHLAAPALAEIDETVTALLRAATEVGVDVGAHEGGRDGSLELEVVLPTGRTLHGMVGPVSGEVVASLQYARLSARHQLAAYARLLALSAARPETAWSAVAIGRKATKTRAKASWCRLGPLGDDPEQRRRRALDGLAVLVDLFDRGMREPLPVYCKTSAEYAQAMARARPDRFAAAGTWDNEWGFPENAELEHQLVLGGGVPYEQLLLEPPGEDERGLEWADVASRFEALSLRLWRPIMDCREEGET